MLSVLQVDFSPCGGEAAGNLVTEAMFGSRQLVSKQIVTA